MLKSSYLDASLVTAQMDAMNYDVALGFRSAVLSGMTTVISSAIGKTNFQISAGSANIQGHQVINNAVLTVPAVPNTSTPATHTLCMTVYMNPAVAVASRVQMEWLTPDFLASRSKGNLFNPDPTRRVVSMGLYTAVHTSVITTLTQYAESYQYNFDGAGNAFGGFAMRVFPHDLVIGSLTSGNFDINLSDITKPSSRFNQYFCIGNPNGLDVAIKQTGIYRLHVSASIGNLTTDPAVPPNGYPLSMIAQAIAGANRPVGSTGVYNILETTLYQKTTQLDTAITLTLFELDRLRVSFAKSTTGLPATATAYNTRYELEFIAMLPESQEGKATY